MDYLYLINERIKTKGVNCYKKDHLYNSFKYDNIIDERVELCHECGNARFLISSFYSMSGFYTFLLRKGGDLVKKCSEIKKEKGLVDKL